MKKTGKEKFSPVAVIIFCLCVVMAAVFFRWLGNTDGVTVCPQQKRNSPEIVYFRQKDSRWADDRLGEAKDTMASSGCLVCTLAAGLDMQAGDGQEAFFMTAGELNAAFSEKEVYTESGAVIWNKIVLAVPGTESYVAETVQETEIDRFLSEGIFPVVKVRMNGYGAYHWVLIVGADEDGYLCMDPMHETQEPVPLSGFANRVYALRAVYFTEGAFP